MDRGEKALLAQRWRDAADAFETLLAAEPNGPHAEDALFGLGTAYEGLELREKARDAYDELVRRFGEGTHARAALTREVAVRAYLEDWSGLGKIGDTLLARKDADDVDRMTALGARGLAKIEAGDDVGAMHDVQNGLDLVDQLKYGMQGRLPVPAAQLRFALGEVRRVRSERIGFLPVTDDFLLKINARCAGLLEAQSAYADAIRSVDPHWAAMSGYRVGEMYRALHKELMSIPPQNAKTDKDRQLFYGMMHVRYRVLLEKGIEMLRRTLTIGEAGQDQSAWIRRAEKAKSEMESALEEEKAQIKTFPFTEEELQKALDILQKKTLEKAAKGK
jgi:tetratricopeptide (TPR) repeat protein